MVLKVSAGQLAYEVSLHRKITLIKGNSGTYKTSFIRTIDANPSPVKQLFGEPLLLASPVTEKMALDGLAAWKNYGVCVIDCDDIKLSDNVSRAINKAQIPIILLARDKVGSVPIHFDSVFTFQWSSGVIRNMRVYAPKLGLKRGLWTVVEDSGLGFRFYNRLLGGNSNVQSAGGYDKVPAPVNALLTTHKEVQVIADASTFGGCCGDIDDISRVTCFLPESFEEVLADSEVFGRFRQRTKIDPLSNTALQFASMERYYEKEVGNILSQAAHVKYEKGVNKNSIKTEQCTLGNCLGCPKQPVNFGGSGACKFFSLYDKDAAVCRTIDFTTGRLNPVVTDNFVLFETGGIPERLSKSGADKTLANAPTVNPESLAGFPEKQIWTESGRLYAVKIGRWYKF